MSKCNYIKLKSFCTAKEFINKMKRQPTEREKMFANCISGKVLTAKIYKETHSTQQKKKSKQSDFKIELSDRHFFKERYTNGQQVYGKVLNIINHQGNINQNHNE